MAFSFGVFMILKNNHTHFDIQGGCRAAHLSAAAAPKKRPVTLCGRGLWLIVSLRDRWGTPAVTEDLSENKADKPPVWWSGICTSIRSAINSVTALTIPTRLEAAAG
jgi:hypothetical protein